MASAYDKASLVMLPNAYKDGKVYSVKPEDRSGDFTFTRSTAATRVNADGNIEKETGNLLLQSNSFDTTWLNYGISLTSGQSGYDGSSDAWLFEKNPALYQSMRQTISKSGVHTYSLYAKAGTLDYVMVYATSSISPKAWFNLSTGAVGSMQGGLIDSSITDMGGGWYRCTIVFSDTITDLRIYPNDTNGSFGSAAGNIFIQDAQLEQGLVARDVITTTTSAVYGGITDNVPRLDYTDSSCPALLLEPLRTNLVTQSEYMGEWAQSDANVTLSDNLSPEGVKNCYRVEGTASGLRVGIATFAAVVGQTYTNSIWVRKVSGSDTAELADGDFVRTQINITTEWQRYNVTGTAVSTVGRLYVLVEEAGDVIEVYGAQQELGSYPTSYIPTYGSSVSRVADSCSKTGISNLIGQTEGTLFLEAKITLDGRLIYLGQAGNFIETLTKSNGQINAFVRTSATQANILSSTTFATGNTIKLALAYAENDFALYINGVQEGSDTNGVVPSNMAGVIMNNYSNAGYASANAYNQALLFPTRLTDSELTALTTI